MAFSLADIPPQEGRVALVTGANSGLGFAIAQALAARGAKVYLACRDAAKAEAARARIEGDAEVVPLDLASLASIHRLAEALHGRLSALDLLVNNAGVMATPQRETEDGFELQLGTNHLGHFALTGQLLPLLRQRHGARIVTLSSLMHRRGKIDFDDLAGSKRYSRWGAYAQSKLANLLFCYELDRRLRAARALAISVAAHPGWTHTQLTRGIPGAGIAGAVLAMSPGQGALPTLMAATAPQVAGGEYFGPTGPFEMRGAAGKIDSSKLSRDPVVAKRLWAVSEQLTGVSFEL